MANNRIPRNAKKIYITWKVDTTGNKSGDRATVEKTERGWIETTESGKEYYMPLALLRNADVVQVDQIETDEPNNRKDVLLSDVGTQVYIIDGASRRATQEAHRRTERHQPEQVHVDSIKTPYRAKWKAESDHRSDNENGRSP